VSTKAKSYFTTTVLAGLITLLSMSGHFALWQRFLIVLPAVSGLYCTYRLALRRLEHEKERVEDMAELHLRTIETLALAIEGEDYVTPGHLRRVEIYAVEIGKDLGLSGSEWKALRAAALLHDIGKLAVPEQITSKPGHLSVVEFEKMKIHAGVGADILEQVEFPYPVAPIVRSHHEKWDGTGYPLGLSGEQIPIGARILAAVDCLDALSSERQYRPAMPPREAMRQVTSEAGRSFDPRVVDALARRHCELEGAVSLKNGRFEKSHALTMRRQETGSSTPADFLSPIAAVRQEAQNLFEFMDELGSSLSLDETLSVMALRLARMCPYDCVAIYIRRGDKLVPEYVSGEDFELFSSLEIPLGEGLSGRVVESGEPVVNGNPLAEWAYLNEPGKSSALHSTLAVPLEGLNGTIGALALYHRGKDAFSMDHLRILFALTHKMALSIENALQYRRAETCAVTDALTNLPNARALFLHLDSELARGKRANNPVTVLVGDLDGFKRANDRLGHPEGNKLLRAVADALRENCREYDYVARMGGDEFVVVLPGHPPEAVGAKMRLLCEAVSEAGRRCCGENLVSMSIGKATFPADGTDAEQLLAEADRRMYQAKRQRWELDGSGKPSDGATRTGMALVG
jgi:diguanylate cyclase (GGDEF)-like protein/putative nucleotidyltransferase with HDIG domain